MTAKLQIFTGKLPRNSAFLHFSVPRNFAFFTAKRFLPLASIDPQGGVLINNVLPFCQYLTNKVESSIYLYDTYDLEIVDIIKDFENGKASMTEF